MTAPPSRSHTLTAHPHQPTAGWKTSPPGASSHPDSSSTPAFTPAETPPHNPNSQTNHLPDLSHLDTNGMEETKTEGSAAKEDAPPVTAQDTSTQKDTKCKDAQETKLKKAACRKHPKGHKHAKKCKAKDDASSESDSSSSSSSSSSDPSESEAEESETSSSSSEEDAEAARKRKLKAKKARKLKERKKAKSKKHKESTEEDSDSDSSDESDSEEETKKKKKSKSRKKRRSKKSRKDVEASASEDEDDDDGLALAKAQLKSLGIRRRGGKGARGGRTQVHDEALRKALKIGKDKGKKKKRCVFRHPPLSKIRRPMATDAV